MDFSFIKELGLLLKGKHYKKTSYSHITKNLWTDVIYDSGKLGEYEIYEYLKCFEEDGAVFLFNLYIPKMGDRTTELDVVMIFRKGIAVLESKNYSGWIFGDKNSKMWMQTLPNGRGEIIKKQFYNLTITSSHLTKHYNTYSYLNFFNCTKLYFIYDNTVIVLCFFKNIFHAAVEIVIAEFAFTLKTYPALYYFFTVPVIYPGL